MESNDANHPAVRTLRAFFREMNEWEWEMIRLTGKTEEMSERDVKKEFERGDLQLKRIFDRYCVIGSKAERPAGDVYWGGEEPDYNPETERILSVDEQGDGVSVQTQMAHQLKPIVKYDLVDVGGSWRIKEPRWYKLKKDDKQWKRWGL